MSEKNKYGQYFTIPLIADFMVSLIRHSKDSRILEPSCGQGVFLRCLEDQGFSNLLAYEIDHDLAKEFSYVCHQSFLSVSTCHKFEVVIGNPPYIRWKNLEQELKEELQNNALWKTYFNSLCDYLFIFILKSIEHLTDNGELIFICTDYWMNSTHSATLRDYICKNGYFSEIYHFKEAPLFEGVTASFVIFRFVKSQKREKEITLYRYNKARGLPLTHELLTLSCFQKEIIPHFEIGKRWLLATQQQQNQINSFEEACKKPIGNLFGSYMFRLGEFCDIGNGMVSGLDAAFQINNTASLNSKEQAALISVIKAKDLRAYHFNNTTPYIFLKAKLEDRQFISEYPHFAEHFKPYLSRLAGRYSYQRDIPYWEFVFPRNQKLFERKEARIFVPCKERISNKRYFRFCYAPSGVFPTQDVTAIFRKPTCRESIEYLLAFLNNRRVFSWLELNGIVKGAIVEFSEAPIASIPYRPINWGNDEEVSIHKSITEEVRMYLFDKEEKHIDSINNHFNQLFKYD
ncbi:MAG: N-6 DNA methylase [Bacteroidales bacterium]|nr:N-6 DNA methylase [Bacteroidales bacterium]